VVTSKIMRNRIPISIIVTLVHSSSSETRKKIAKKNKRMLKHRNKHPKTGDTRLLNAFGTNGRMIFIGSFD
jgi:hypothetical protein